MEIKGMIDNSKLKQLIKLAVQIQKEQNISKEDALKAAALQLKQN